MINHDTVGYEIENHERKQVVYESKKTNKTNEANRNHRRAIWRHADGECLA